jgi:hypothetical protein
MEKNSFIVRLQQNMALIVERSRGDTRAPILREAQAQNLQALAPQQEQELPQYIKQLTERGLPSTRPMIRRFAVAHDTCGTSKTRRINVTPSL